MRVTESYCVGCPQGCIRCGRDKVTHYKCDSCDADNIDGETIIYKCEDGHFCAKCMVKRYLDDFIDDLADEWVSENFEEINEDQMP